MPKQTRYLLFLIGTVLGCVFILPVFQARLAERAGRAERDARRQLPGMFVEAATTGISIREENQKFILEEGVEAAPPGFAHRRVLVTGGRRKFEKTGRPAPDSFIKITEDYAVAAPSPMTPVAQISFAYADRVAVELAPGATASDLEQLVTARQASLAAAPESNGTWTVRLAGHALADVPAMLAWLREHPEIATQAGTVVIDWRTELN